MDLLHTLPLHSTYNTVCPGIEVVAVFGSYHSECVYMDINMQSKYDHSIFN